MKKISKLLLSLKEIGPLAKIPLLIISLFLVGVGSFYIGRISVALVPPQIVIPAHVTSPTKPNLDFGIFWEAWNTAQDLYLFKSKINEKEMVYGATRGMIKSLNDPYTEFFTPEENKTFAQEVGGAFGGIGAEIGFKNEDLTIIAPLKGNQAEAVGLQAGDRILKIDAKIVTKDMSLDEAIRLIRGPIDTKVKLLILRKDAQTPKEFEITRKEVVIPTAELDMLEGGIAHIKLYNFNARAASKFYSLIYESLLKGTKGYIVDVRNNPGGFLEVGIDIASHFIEPGQIVVKEENYKGQVELHRSSIDGSAVLRQFPVVLLANEGSASASEILIGALRDNRGTKLIGKKTFGKGVVQELRTLSDGSSLKVTIARWLTPKGTSLANGGLVPDYEINFTEEDAKNKRDPQLSKAIEVLKEQIK
ncbi:MAG: S41 family peptidase [Parcubacteria group bacterium]|nr:S41 family peptidase [Parcubacteria group bacterium]